MSVFEAVLTIVFTLIGFFSLFQLISISSMGDSERKTNGLGDKGQGK